MGTTIVVIAMTLTKMRRDHQMGAQEYDNSPDRPKPPVQNKQQISAKTLCREEDRLRHSEHNLSHLDPVEESTASAANF
ncbi:hypothetical protein NYF23_09490 [SAR92 clade bacterium H455]|uniref:Uncharacterized protein n=1 Tax=SAR92 clade bacterium H455 TaxID=2974818 RepID=A0ABY5TK58_9GAMM|nr:hypothetical protein NYF23_09490 [SAR92 clade bacterium H455]